MSRTVLTLLAVALVISGIGVAGAAGGDSDRERELLAEIEKLRTRVEALEERLKALEARPTKPVEPPAPPMTFRWAPPVPPGGSPRFYAPTPERLPDGTVEREFNGMMYYIMPIANAPTFSTTAPVLASPKH